MIKQFHQLVSPKYFYNLAVLLTPWFAWLTVLLMIAGLYGGLVFAPADYQQGESCLVDTSDAADDEYSVTLSALL